MSQPPTARPICGDAEDLTSRSWTVEQAFAFCDSLTAGHYENFPVGSLLVPRELRPHVHAIYAFARIADDYADEPQYHDSMRLALLENWESQLLQSLWRRPQHPVFIALKETIERFGLPPDLFRDLLTAFKLDVVKKRQPTFSDVLAYCRCSANPVGRLVLLLFQYRDPELHELSDAVCTALQLANFWQDIPIDLAKGRIYLPLEDLERFGYSEEDLNARVYNDAFIRLMRFQTERTRSLFSKGRPLARRVGKDLRFELSLVWEGGNHILRLLEKNRFDVFSRRPVVTKAGWVQLGARAFWASRFS
jgi:squalene synthase HpnC